MGKNRTRKGFIYDGKIVTKNLGLFVYFWRLFLSIKKILQIFVLEQKYSSSHEQFTHLSVTCKVSQ